MITLEYRKLITRRMLKIAPKTIFVFGDNIEREGYGGQAKEMRGEPNAFGIATKVSPDVYMQDCSEHLNYVLNDLVTLQSKITQEYRMLRDLTVVWPADGIGTGRALLRSKAPGLYKLIKGYHDALRGSVHEVVNPPMREAQP